MSHEKDTEVNEDNKVPALMDLERQFRTEAINTEIYTVTVRQ